MCFNIVLFEPEKPLNTGNIGRTCVLTNSKLHLIKPFNFSLGEKEVKRAGLDYWKDVNLSVYENFYFMKNINIIEFLFVPQKLLNFIQILLINLEIVFYLGRNQKDFLRK